MLAPGRLSHMPSCCKSILGVTVESVQGNNVYLEWIGTAVSFEIVARPLEFCRAPACGILPVANIMKKEACHKQRQDQTSGIPWDILEHLPPKLEFTYFTALCFHLHF